MDKIEPKELADQLRKPSGKNGKEVGESMNDSNAKLYDLAFDNLTFGNDDNILEIGFGNGMFITRYFEVAENASVYGHDYSLLMCEQAKENNKKWYDQNRLKITCGDCLEMNYDDDFFNKIIAINTIYFWEPVRSYFKEIKRVLQPGGQFLIGFRPKKNVEQLEFTRHNFTLYEPDEIIKIADECGLHLITQGTNEYQKKSADGMTFDAIDICLVFSK